MYTSKKRRSIPVRFLPFILLLLFISAFWMCKLTSPYLDTPRPTPTTFVKGSQESKGSQLRNSPIVTTDRHHQQYFFIIPKKGKIGAILKQRGWIQVNNASLADFIWVQNKAVLSSLFAKDEATSKKQINHLAYERQMSHKGRLLHYLHAKYKMNGYPYMQSSFLLSDLSERAQFLTQVTRNNSSELEQKWIAKIPSKGI